MSTCRSCGAEILWSETMTGKKIPLDPEQVLGGNIVLEAEGALARIVKPEPGVKRYRSHFASCPQAEQHRRPR